MASFEKEERQEKNKLSDRELWQKVLKEDMSAFEILVDRYKIKLFNVIYRMLRNKEEAEDILQETFFRVYKNKESYDFAFCFSTWIYTIALNLVRNELRRKKRFKFFSLDLIKNSPDHSFKEVENKNRTNLFLEKAIFSLPPKYKTVFLLRDLDQMSYDEIAQVLEIPIGTVKSRVNRARLILRKKLKPRWEEYYELSKGSQMAVQLF